MCVVVLIGFVHVIVRVVIVVLVASMFVVVLRCCWFGGCVCCHCYCVWVNMHLLCLSPMCHVTLVYVIFMMSCWRCHCLCFCGCGLRVSC